MNLLTIGSASDTEQGAIPRRAFVAQIMGLPMSIHVRGPRAREDRVAEAVEAAFAELRADEEIFSIWRPDSPVSRIRDGRDELRDALPRIKHVAGLCELAGQRTGGAFTAWLPDAAGRLRFNPTGLVKGWAVEQAFTGLGRRLAFLGAHDLMINAGGDIAASCTRTDTPDWRVGIEDPRDRARMLRTLELRVGAVATSGTAARGLHIIDPTSGRPVDELASATVVGPELTWADVYATAAFVRGPRAAAWIATLTDHLGVLVTKDGMLIAVSPPQKALRQPA